MSKALLQRLELVGAGNGEAVNLSRSDRPQAAVGFNPRMRNGTSSFFLSFVRRVATAERINRRYATVFPFSCLPWTEVHGYMHHVAMRRAEWMQPFRG